MKRLSDRLTGAAVLAFMSVILLLTLFHHKETYSESEDRQLASFPGVSDLSDGDFTQKLTLYASDHFVGRSGWIAMRARFDSTFCESISRGVYIDEERLLDTQPAVTSDLAEAATDVNSFAEGYDGAVYFAAVPTSAGVYSDTLPGYLGTVTEKQQIDSFYEHLNPRIRTIDAYNILKMLGDNYIYYRTDPRWTSYGAYAVYRTVIQKLGFQPSKYDKYTIEHVTDSYRGTLFRRSQYMLSKPDIIDIYEYSGEAEVTSCCIVDKNGTQTPTELYDRSALNTADMYSIYLGDEVPLLRIETSVNNQRRLLVIKDSYANCFIPFLTQHYSRIDVVSPQLLDDDLRSYINISDYEQTLFLLGLSTLDNSGYFEWINQKEN